MSETATRKTQPNPRDGAQQVREAAQSTAESTVRAAKDTVGRAEDVFNRTADEARDIGVSVADTVARTADAAVDITQRVAEQGREVIWLGVRAAAGVNGRLADVSYGRSHHVLGQTARALEIYRKTGESTAENMQALFTSWMSFGRGMQEMQHAWLELLDHATGNGARKPQDVLRCKSVDEAAEIQRDLWFDAVNHAMEASTRMLQIAGRVSQEAMRPLQNRTQIARV
ncbi:MAG TPA: phasin family protein [Acetobacteraceae bacterium]|nr:phasin family protein [Acetobacteraceae bacterium]